MNQAHELELRGCTPEPLMAYLKALGIFRLVAEQKDSGARGFWKNDAFLLRSALDREALVQFFLDEYRPTPIVSPWNGGSGFHAKDNSKAMNTILGLESPKFRIWNEVISTGKQILAQSGSTGKESKERVLAECRARFPDEALDWLDAAYVLTADGPKYPPLLGTGGNDGRLDFSNNFMQSVVLALNLDQRRNGDAITHNQIVAALFNEGSPELVRKRSTGFYNPGSVGGANASVGFNDESMTNPWDYALMFEGTLLFAGAAARRLSSQSSPKAVFPFTVDNTAAGYGTSADSEYGGSARAEFWAPLWDQPANRNELTHLASEGRAQLGRRQVSNGTDFARAVAGLGTERGVSQFQRYGFLERNGLAFLAAPLGRFYIQDDRDTAQAANVLFDLDPWLESLRRAATGRNAPPAWARRCAKWSRPSLSSARVASHATCRMCYWPWGIPRDGWRPLRFATGNTRCDPSTVSPASGFAMPTTGPQSSVWPVPWPPFFPDNRMDRRRPVRSGKTWSRWRRAGGPSGRRAARPLSGLPETRCPT